MRLLLVIFAAGCGRFGFDARPGATDAAPDATPLPPFALAGQRFLVPCGMHTSALGCSCPASPVIQSVTLAGAPTDHYAVTIRARGSVGMNTYAGGAAGPGGLYTGGATTSTNGDDTYEIAVSAPPTVLWLNAAPALSLSAVAIDYAATIRVDGAATVTFTADCHDGLEWQNLDAAMQPITFPGVTTTPDPYDGQFAQIDVLDAMAL